MIDGDIDLKSCIVNGKVTCGGSIIDGIFNGEVVNNGKIIGGIFYGAVSGNGKIEDSAKRTVSFDSKGGSAVESQKILRGQRAVVPADCKKKTDIPSAAGAAAARNMTFRLPFSRTSALRRIGRQRHIP